MKVPVDLLKSQTNQQSSLKAQEISAEVPFEEIKVPPENLEKLKEITEGNIIGSEENLRKRKEMIDEKAIEPTDFAFERAIGQNDSLYSNFIELLATTKRKVARIVVRQNGKRLGYGTGFMVSKSLMLTNWHVFKSPELAIESEAYFFYEYDVKGGQCDPVLFKFDVNQFYNCQELDYCFVGVNQKDVTGKVDLQDIGYLFLDRNMGKLGDVGVERLNIIHHPHGDYKQISIRENTFVDVDETRIFYETDTAPGSSGSPVFNDQWQVVGLHHKSIAKMNEAGDYLDKNNKIIPPIDGTIDLGRIVWLKNEGMRISVILNHLEKENNGVDAVREMSEIPTEPKLEFVPGSYVRSENQKNITGMDNSSNDIRIYVPVDSIASGKPINIHLSTQGPSAEILQTTPKSKTGNVSESILEEIAKADKEKAVDFSKCKGYDPNFLGIEIKMPQPKKSIQKQVALLKNKSNELKYFKYSVIFSSTRRMPLISAVNVEGNPEKRKDKSKRKDDWLRDVRIDVEPQLFDKFYAGSQLDKGHMSRFEDANWDNTEEAALRNGIYTCFYTNACPQVVALNRAAGLWGKLEKQVLEKGIGLEDGKQARMTVFYGPIFDDEKDKIYLGVTIPMQFYKVICWLNDENKLRVTAFRLSQETLVDHIRFDEMVRIEDLEALDIDRVTTFKKYQLNLKS
jgi:endonuclease G